MFDNRLKTQHINSECKNIERQISMLLPHRWIWMIYYMHEFQRTAILQIKNGSDHQRGKKLQINWHLNKNHGFFYNKCFPLSLWFIFLFTSTFPKPSLHPYYLCSKYLFVQTLTQCLWFKQHRNDNGNLFCKLASLCAYMPNYVKNIWIQNALPTYCSMK